MAPLPLVDWDWIGRNLDAIWDRTVQHLALTGIAIGVGLAISLVLSALAIRWPRAYAPITSVSGVLYTIPALAMFALVRPFAGFGYLAAEFALVTYTLLILVRNTVIGIRGIPSEVREAADGMGYRRAGRLFGVELPLALPVIIAGVRIATVTVVGLVTVTSLIGLGGLGFFILDGFNRSIMFPTGIVVGTVLSVVLAVLLDLIILLVGRGLTPWARRGRAA